jgi:hypothetical protein
MSEPEAVRAEVDALFCYGGRLSPEELEAVRKDVEAIVHSARALRAVRLANTDEPGQPFAPYRADT